MTPARWGIFGAICAIILVGLILLSGGNKIDVSGVDPAKIQASDHVFGNKDSKVILIEYGDYQCPGCGGAFAKLKSLSETYQNQIAFVFRNFPLTTIHPNALAAATAAEAAAKQGKFWEMHDLLYQNQSNWENASTTQRAELFESYAKSLGINISQFRADQKSDAITHKINFDRALGEKIGANSTPTLVLNGQRIDDNTVADVIQGNGDLLKAKLQAAIKKTGQTVPKDEN